MSPCSRDPKIAGNLDGGGGANTLALDGAAGTSDTMSANLTNFGSLTKNGAGAWTLSGTATDNLGAQPRTFRYNGELILTGNNPGFGDRFWSIQAAHCNSATAAPRAVSEATSRITACS